MTGNPGGETVHRELDTDADSPAARIAEIIADLEGRDHADLSTMYECIDHVVDNVFSTPPAPEADLQIRFSYEGYRITVEQTGDLKLVRADADRE